MKITRTQLLNIISESVKDMIKNGTLNEFFDGGVTFPEEKEKDKEESQREKNRENRTQIEDFFDKPGVNNAQYAYKLYGVTPQKGKDTKAMKNARSQFQKDLHHEKNDSGYPYNFTPQELNRLQSMISSNQLSEAVDKAIKNVIKNEERNKEIACEAISKAVVKKINEELNKTK